METVLSNVRSFPGGRQKHESNRVARILRPGYVCDIIRDPHTDPPIFHWVVQDCETNEITGLGQAYSLGEAEQHASAFLFDLRQRRAI